MFRSARWRGEKNKIKSVFKLKFYATQVAELNADALMISVVPGDVGKPTVKLEAAIVRDGVCQWENSVFETVKFTRELKTGKIIERLYSFIVSSGSLKASVVGEASIDFADYAETTKPSTVSLSLKNSNSKAVLHVTIQRLHANVEQSFRRDVAESEDTKSQDGSLKLHLSNGDTDESIKRNPCEDGPLNKLSHNTDRRVSSVSDMTISSSESSSGFDTPPGLGMRNTNIHQDSATSLLSLLSDDPVIQKPEPNGSTRIYEEHQRSQWDWSEGSDHGISTDDSTNSSQETLSRERSLQASDHEFEKLKAELVALSRQVDVSELELQTLRKQVVKESKRGQDLTKEVAYLREERDALKAECEKLKGFHNCRDEAKIKNKLQLVVGDPWAPLEELRQELNYEKELNANLRLQLQKTQDSNAELLLAVQDLDDMLQQKNKEISKISAGPREDAEEVKDTMPRSETYDDEEQKALEELVKEHRDAKETYQLDEQITDLRSEIEIYRRDKDELEMQMEQLALDYEILKQENHDISYKLEQSQLQEQLKMQYECSSSFVNINELESQIESLENDLKKNSKELSDSLVTIKDLETQVKSLEEELEKQAQRFEADLDTVTRAKVEQEQRAILAEEALRTTRWKNISTAEKHSKELSDSFVTIKDLETQVKSLEEELEKQALGFEADLDTVTRAKVEQEQRAILAEEALQTTRWKNSNTAEQHSKELSDSFVTIKDLETQVKILEEELEKQAQGFEADLDTVTRAKVEQEQRAILAEEALRTTKWKNINTAEKLQDEIKSLSKQMASIFEANEKVAMKSLSEASQLCLQNSQLEEMLEKTYEELQSVKDDYEEKLHELSNQLKIKADQLEQILEETMYKSKQLEEQEKHKEEVSVVHSQEILNLKAEIKRLMTDNNLCSLQAEQKEKLEVELEQMKKSIKETELLVQRGKVERNELVSTIALVKKEADKSMEELDRVRCLKDEKERAIKLLQSELETLKIQCNDLKHSLFEDELEKEKLKKQVSQLKGDLKKKEDALTSADKKLKDSNGRTAVNGGTKPTPRNNKSAPVSQDSKEVANLRERINMLEGQIKLKEAALETSTNMFLEKEKNLKSRIYELEDGRVEEPYQSSASFNDDHFHKVAKDAFDNTSNRGIPEEACTPESLSCTVCISRENGSIMSPIESDKILAEEELKAVSINSKDCNLDEFINELVILKERNESVESELQEMQERYSQISLKFAEVEGERQKLVMTVRNLKNALKSAVVTS